MALMTNLSRAFTLINSSKKTMVVIKVQCLIKMQRKYRNYDKWTENQVKMLKISGLVTNKSRYNRL